jgi:hypothetical protein
MAGLDPAIPLRMAQSCQIIGIAGSSPAMTVGVLNAGYLVLVYLVKNTSRRGNFSNTEASTEKFVARMSVGLPAIHWERSIVW